LCDSLVTVVSSISDELTKLSVITYELQSPLSHWKMSHPDHDHMMAGLPKYAHCTDFTVPGDEGDMTMEEPHSSQEQAPVGWQIQATWPVVI